MLTRGRRGIQGTGWLVILLGLVLSGIYTSRGAHSDVPSLTQSKTNVKLPIVREQEGVRLEILALREVELLRSGLESWGKYAAVSFSLASSVNGAAITFPGGSASMRFADNTAVDDWMVWLPEEVSREKGGIVTAIPRAFARQLEVISKREDLDKYGRLLVSGNTTVDQRSQAVRLDNKQLWDRALWDRSEQEHFIILTKCEVEGVRFDSTLYHVPGPRVTSQDEATLVFQFPDTSQVVSGVLLFRLSVDSWQTATDKKSGASMRLLEIGASERKVEDIRSLRLSPFGEITVK